MNSGLGKITDDIIMQLPAMIERFQKSQTPMKIMTEDDDLSGLFF